VCKGGAGEWKCVCGDAKRVLVDEAVVDNINRDELFVLTLMIVCVVVESSATLSAVDVRHCVHEQLGIRRCVVQRHRRSVRRASAGGRSRCVHSQSVASPSTRLCWTTGVVRVAQVYDVPADGVDWRAHKGVHWTALSVLPLGVRQQSSASVSRKFRKMSESIY
jgi:hypothetical protein